MGVNRRLVETLARTLLETLVKTLLEALENTLLETLVDTLLETLVETLVTQREALEDVIQNFENEIRPSLLIGVDPHKV
jgi:hypothetical protein